MSSPADRPTSPGLEREMMAAIDNIISPAAESTTSPTSPSSSSQPTEQQKQSKKSKSKKSKKSKQQQQQQQPEALAPPTPAAEAGSIEPPPSDVVLPPHHMLPPPPPPPQFLSPQQHAAMYPAGGPPGSSGVSSDIRRKRSLVRPERARSGRRAETLGRNTTSGSINRSRSERSTPEGGRSGGTIGRSETIFRRSLARKKTTDTPRVTWWVITSRVMTACFPNFFLATCCGKKDPYVQQAFREKVTLCIIIALIMGVVGFLTFGFTAAVCGKPDIRFKLSEFYQPGRTSFIGIRGKAWSIEGFVHPIPRPSFDTAVGRDLTALFPPRGDSACARVGARRLPCQIQGVFPPGNRTGSNQEACHLTFGLEQYDRYLRPAGQIYLEWDEIKQKTLSSVPGNPLLIAYNGMVLDVQRYVQNPDMLPREVYNLTMEHVGLDATKAFHTKGFIREAACLVETFQIAVVDSKTVGCFASDVVLWVSLVFIVGVVMIKFLLAVFFSFVIGSRGGARGKKGRSAEDMRRRQKEFRGGAAGNDGESSTSSGSADATPRGSTTNDAGSIQLESIPSRNNTNNGNNGGNGNGKKDRMKSRFTIPLPGEGVLAGRSSSIISGNTVTGSSSRASSPANKFLNAVKSVDDFSNHSSSSSSSSFSSADSTRFGGSPRSSSPALEQQQQQQRSASPSSSSSLREPTLPSVEVPPEDAKPLPLVRRWSGANLAFMDFNRPQLPEIETDPVMNDPSLMHTLIMVPCYSEGYSSLRLTLDSVANTYYPTTHKCIFAIADGIVQGAGNSKATPEFLVDMMEVDERFRSEDPRWGGEPQAYSYVAIADGTKRRNFARVYAGWYRYSKDEKKKGGRGLRKTNTKETVEEESSSNATLSSPNTLEEDPTLTTTTVAQDVTGTMHTIKTRKSGRIPMILVVKVGNEEERTKPSLYPKPGNRGKRDSQLILMNFLTKCMFDDRMTELEFDIFFKLWTITGMSPERYEAVLMVDADTK
ncbi:Chitin synthase, class 3, partial [Quaeritorhiza haematococci]